MSHEIAERNHPAVQAAQAVARRHGIAARASYAGHFPSFLAGRVSRTSRILFDETARCAAPASERALFRTEFLSITSALREPRLESRTLHGDPHRGNLLISDSGCLMIDFESVCSGPLEWDLSAMPDKAARIFSVDAVLLALLRRLRSLCVAVCGWTRAN